MSRDELTCEQVIEQLFAFLDGELDSELNVEFDRHLARCRDCFTRAEFERKLRAKINEAASEKAPERLHKRIRGLLDRF